MKGETDVSYLSAFYYTASVLLLLTSVFCRVQLQLGNGCWVLHFRKRSL